MGLDRYRYGLELLAAPTVDPISPEQARQNCSIEGDYHNEFLADLTRQAREYVEQRAAVALTTTQYKLTCDRFPRGCEALYLPIWPLLSVDAVSYVAEDGSTAAIALEGLKVRKDRNGQAILRLADFGSWPIPRLTPDAVEITFTAGFGSDPEAVPAPWRRAVLMLVSWWFEQRETASTGASGSVPYGLEQLIEAAANLDDYKPFDLG